MTVEVNGQEYTLQQAAKFLISHDSNCARKCTAKYRNAGCRIKRP